MQTIDFAYIEYRLNEWARWCVRKLEAGLGYPTKSMEGKLREMGGLLFKSTYPNIYSDNPNAEQIEALLQELNDFSQDVALVLKKHYLTLGGTEQKAKQLGMSKTQYHVALGMGRCWLAGRLSMN